MPVYPVPPTAAAIADAIVSKQRHVEPYIMSFTGTAVASLPVASGQRGRIVSMSHSNSGGCRLTLSGSAPTVANSFELTGNVSSDINLNNVDLSMVRILNTTGAGTTHIAYEVYL